MSTNRADSVSTNYALNGCFNSGLPKRARAILAAMASSGPPTRQDAENAAKTRWLLVIGHITAGTNATGPSCCVTSRLRLFRRSRTLRGLFAFRTISFGVSSSGQHKQSWSQSESWTITFLQLRVDEPCTRNALKRVHEAFDHLEVVAEGAPEARLTRIWSPKRGQATRQDKRQDFCWVWQAREETVVNVHSSPVRSCFVLGSP